MKIIFEIFCADMTENFIEIKCFILYFSSIKSEFNVPICVINKEEISYTNFLLLL
jgi:hypothetical protein